MRPHTGVGEVVAARAATAGSEHGAVGGAEGRSRAVVAGKNGRVSRSTQGVLFFFEATLGSSVPRSASWASTNSRLYHAIRFRDVVTIVLADA